MTEICTDHRTDPLMFNYSNVLVVQKLSSLVYNVYVVFCACFCCIGSPKKNEEHETFFQPFKSQGSEVDPGFAPFVPVKF